MEVLCILIQQWEMSAYEAIFVCGGTETKILKQGHRKGKTQKLLEAITTCACSETRPLLMPACVPLRQQVPASSCAVCVGLLCFACKHVCAGEHPAQSRRCDPARRHHDTVMPHGREGAGG